MTSAAVVARNAGRERRHDEAGAGRGRRELRQIFDVIDEGDVATAGLGERAHVVDHRARVGTLGEFGTGGRRDFGERIGTGTVEKSGMLHQLPPARRCFSYLCTVDDVEWTTARAFASPGSNRRQWATSAEAGVGDAGLRAVKLLEPGRGAEAEELRLVVAFFRQDLGEVHADRADRRVPHQAGANRRPDRRAVLEAGLPFHWRAIGQC